MPESPYDFAIFGSTPLAGLLAGLLATAHQKRVVRVGDASSAFRLPRGIDLSVMPVTRPETWALLRDNTTEVLKLLGRIHGRAGWQRVDPIFVAETAEGADALSHLRHVATSFGYAVERLPPGGATGGVAYKLRDALLLRRARLEPAITAWHDRAGVGQLAARDVGVTIRRDGSARIEYRGTTIEAAHAVLVDEAAIIGHLDAAERDRTLQVESATSLLTEPTRALASPAMVYVDRGVTLMRARGGSIVGLSVGPTEQAVQRIGGCLAGHGPLRRSGQRIFPTIATFDGAPLVGTARGLRATVLASLGLGGAFMAPAIARLLAGAASEREKSYFAAREAGRGKARALVADFAADPAFEVQP